MAEPLQDYQKRALSVLGRATALLDGAVPDARALGQCRWEFARVLRAYQIHKHRYVFDPAIAAGGPAERVALARQLKGACVQMGERFRVYLLCWSGRSICDTWAEYRPAALAMVAELRAHLERERAGIALLETAAPPSSPRYQPAAAPMLRF